MVSSGISGSITGKGADLMIIDDPVKNRQEADSITYRDRVWNEWKSTLATRLHPNASVVIVLTRWHEDDLAGRLINEEAGRWKLLNFPAIAEGSAEGSDDLLGRAEGEALWPERYGVKELEEKKDNNRQHGLGFALSRETFARFWWNISAFMVARLFAPSERAS